MIKKRKQIFKLLVLPLLFISLLVFSFSISINGATHSYIYNPTFSTQLSNDTSSLTSKYSLYSIDPSLVNFPTSGNQTFRFKLHSCIINVTSSPYPLPSNLEFDYMYFNVTYTTSNIIVNDIGVSLRLSPTSLHYVDISYTEFDFYWIDILSFDYNYILDYFSSPVKYPLIFLDRVLTFPFSYSFNVVKEFDTHDSLIYFSETLSTNPLYYGYYSFVPSSTSITSHIIVNINNISISDKIKYNNITSNNMGIVTCYFLNKYLNFTDYTFDPNNLSNSNYTFNDLFLSILNVPIIYLQNLFSFEILGVNVYAILFSIILVGICFYLAFKVFRR